MFFLLVLFVFFCVLWLQKYRSYNNYFEMLVVASLVVVFSIIFGDIACIWAIMGALAFIFHKRSEMGWETSDSIWTRLYKNSLKKERATFSYKEVEKIRKFVHRIAFLKWFILFLLCALICGRAYNIIQESEWYVGILVGIPAFVAAIIGAVLIKVSLDEL